MTIHLKPVVDDDARQIFEWRNDPFVIEKSTLKKAVTWNEHQAWFAAALKDGTKKIYLVFNGEEKIGSVRFDRIDTNDCVISAYVLRQFTGKGWGVAAIREACRMIAKEWPVKSVLAFVLEDNTAGLSGFLKAGFVFVDDRNCPQAHRCLRCDVEALTSAPSDSETSMKVPHNRLTHGAQETAAVSEVIQSGRWAAGRKVDQFERQLEQWANVKHVVCVGSGLAALRLSLAALGVAQGDTVLLPGYSCVALPNAVLANGAKPVAVDVKKNTWNLDFGKLNAMSESGTSAKAIIAVHTFGHPLEAATLRQLDCDCIEDWAHGFRLAKDGVTPAGLDSTVAIQSFYATKLMGAGEGGAVLTHSDDIAQYVRTWRDYSDQQPSATRLNDKMTDIAAAIGIEQLKRLPSMIRRRKELADQYTDAFSSLAWLQEHVDLPVDSALKVWYRYPVFLKTWAWQELVDLMGTDGVSADSPIWNWHGGNSDAGSVSEDAFRGVVSLPLYPSLTTEEQTHVIRIFIKACSSLRKKYEHA